MRSLLRIIIIYHFQILFVILEVVSISLLLNHNNFQKARFLNLTQSITGRIYDKINNTTAYLSLKKTNYRLSEENAKLKNILERTYRSDELFFFGESDSIHHQHYFYTSAKVINQTVNKQHNFLTLNKGSDVGIRPEMGVVSPNGVIGIVVGVSKQFSTVISLLNLDFRVSAKLAKNNYFGSLHWDGKDYRKVKLDEIPYHIDVNVGDTVITSGYSSIFPEGIIIGTVSNSEVKGGNFYEIEIDLSVDFKSLVYVELIGNLQRKEQIELEELGND